MSVNTSRIMYYESSNTVSLFKQRFPVRFSVKILFLTKQIPGSCSFDYTKVTRHLHEASPIDPTEGGFICPHRLLANCRSTG